MTKSKPAVFSLLIGLLVIVLGRYAWALLPGSNSHSGSERLGTVNRGTLQQRITVAGVLAPRRKSLILAPYEGFVDKVFVKVGEQVKAGQPLISLKQSLRGGGAENFPLVAAFSGTVVQTFVMGGEYVIGGNSGSPLLRVDDLSQMLVEANVPELEVPKIFLGQEVVVRASPILNKSYRGIIRKIPLSARESKDYERARVEFPVQIELLDRDPQLRSGFSAIVDIVAASRKNVLVLSQEFVHTEGDKSFVILPSGERRRIEVGLQNEEGVEVLSGLKEGERVKPVDFLNGEG